MPGEERLLYASYLLHTIRILFVVAFLGVLTIGIQEHELPEKPVVK